MPLVVESYECCVCLFTFKNKEYLKRHTINEHEPSGAIWMLRMLIYFQKQRIFEETQDKRTWTLKSHMNVLHVDLLSKIKNIWRDTRYMNMNLVEPYECCVCWLTFKIREYLNIHKINEHEPCGGVIWMLRMFIYFQK